MSKVRLKILVSISGIDKKLGEKMENRKFNARFNCNEYYLMANLLAYSYKFADKDKAYYQRQNGINQMAIDEFMGVARELPEIQSLLNYGADFDKQPDNESRNKLAEDMGVRLGRIAEVKDDMSFIRARR